MFRFASVVVPATLSIVGLASASAGASSAPVTTPSSCLLDAATVSEVSGADHRRGDAERWRRRVERGG